MKYILCSIKNRLQPMLVLLLDNPLRPVIAAMESPLLNELLTFMGDLQITELAGEQERWKWVMDIETVFVWWPRWVDKITGLRER